MIGSYPFRRVLEFEAVTENQLVALGAVLPELLLELGGGLRLDVADRGAKAVPDAQQALIGSAVPGLVADRPGREERHAERCRGTVASLASRIRPPCALITPRENYHRADREPYGKAEAGNVDNCGKTVFARGPLFSNYHSLLAVTLLWTKLDPMRKTFDASQSKSLRTGPTI